MAVTSDDQELMFEDSLDNIDTIYERFYEKGWIDGLPIIPPTRDRVANMMTTVDRIPDYVVGQLGPRFSDATIEKLAINAVMAGCMPAYFPVIVTAVEAICAPEFAVQLHQATTSPTAILAVINGPVRGKIDINCSWGLFGPGWRANATIGRAISLIMLNVGGRIPGEITKSVFANPGRYGMCVGEREEISPWEPFHVEMGFSSNESTVTVMASNGYHSIEAYLETEAEELLETLACFMKTSSVLPIYPVWGENEIFVFLCPEYARIMANGGYSKKDVQQYFYEHTVDIPFSLFSKSLLNQIQKFDNGELDYYRSKQARVEAGLISPNQNQITEKGVAFAARPDQFKLLVAGGDGGINGVWLPPWTHTNMVIKPIKCAAKGVYD